MSPEQERLDVIVVGAGPVGLGVALGVARAGRSVVVLEKKAATAEHSRAPAIWPRSQEILAGLGVLERFLQEGFTLDRLRLWDADADEPLITLPLSELASETPFPRLLILPQATTEQILCQAVRSRETARVLFSAEAVAVEQDERGVCVRYRKDDELHLLRAAFAVGCDGASSMVRKSIGATFDGHTYGTRAALADIRAPTPEDLPFPRLSRGDGLAVAIRMNEDVWRLILPFAPTEERELSARVETAAVNLFPGIASTADYDTVWQSEFTLHRRMASRLVRHRIALAGDAAHLNSPVGGQGMNAGIQDAALLSAALLEAVAADDPAPLREYERVRRPAVDRGVNRFTHRLTKLLLWRRGKAVGPGLRLASFGLRVSPLRRRLLRRLAMLEDGIPAGSVDRS